MELGYVRNLLPANYGVPFFGSPIDCAGADVRADQPMLCTIDQEVFCEPCQPIAGLSNPGADLVGPVYAVDAINHAVQHIQRLCQGYKPRPQEMGNNAGAVAGTCGVNLRNGNLVVSLCLPGGGPSDPPIRFYYNSQSVEDSEYGFGWSGLYRQWVELGGASSSSSASRTWLTEIHNPAGKIWRIERDEMDGRILQIVDPFKQATVFSYDTNDRLKSVKDSGGRATEFSINADGQLGSVTSPAGFVTKLSYDSENLLTGWTNHEGHKTTFKYDDCMRIKSIRTPEGETTKYTYPSEDPGEVVITNARNYPTTITLDDHGNAEVVQEPEGITTTYTWDDKQRLESFQDGRGKTTSFAYEQMSDLSKRLATVEQPIGTLAISYAAATAEVVSIRDQESNLTYLFWKTLEDEMTPGVVERIRNAESRDYDLAYNGSGQIEALTDPLTHTTTYTHDGRGRRKSVENAENQTTSFGYNGYSQVKSVTDPIPATTNFIRDEDNRVLTVTDPLTHSTWFEYDDNGRLKVTENTLFKKWKRTYDKDGRLETVTDPEGNQTEYTYDSTFNTTAIKSPRGFTTSNMFDGVNRLTQTTNPDTETTSFEYDDADNQTEVTNPLSKTWTYTYDNNNRLETRLDPLVHKTTFTYDAFGNQTSVENPLFETTATAYDVLNRVEAVQSMGETVNTITYSYDPAGRLESVENADQQTTTYEYDDANRLEVVTDPKGNETEYTYDAAGRRETVTNGDNKTATMAYDAAGRHTSTIDAGLSTTAFEYDNADQVIEVINPEGDSSFKTYYANGQLKTETNEEGETTTFTYDADSQVEEIQKPLARTTTYVYDNVGRLEAMQAPEGVTTEYDYDAADRRIGIVNGLGETTVFGYDVANRLIKVTTPENRITTLGYDNADRPNLTTDPRMNTTGITYYPNGTVKTTVDARSKITTYVYDKADRLKEVTDPLIRTWTTVYDAAGNIEVEETPRGFKTTYTYDGANRLETTLDAESRTTTHAYHPNGLLHTVEQFVAPGETYTTTYMYDLNGRIETVATPRSGSAETTTYDYDMAGRVLTVTNPRGFETSFTYDAAGRQTELRRALNGSQTAVATTVYDASDRVVEQISPTGIATTFIYDAASRLLQMIDGTNKTYAYNYDKDNNQTEVTTPLGFTTTYTYDANGNLWTQKLPSPLNHVTTFVYDENNRQIEIIDAENNTTTNIYDAAGRLTEVKDAEGLSTIFELDDDDRLDVLIDAENQKTTYSYDKVGNQTIVLQPDGGTASLEYNGLDKPKKIVTTNTALTTQTLTYYTSGRLEAEITHEGISGPTEITTYTYDSAGNTTSIQNAAGTVNMAYDAANRITTQAFGGQTTSTEYFENGLPKKVTPGSATATEYTYDGVGRPKTIKRGSKTTTLTYDADGRETLKELPNGVPTGIKFSMTYNNAAWLTRRQEIAGVAIISDDQYTYNNVGIQTNTQGSTGTLTYDKTYQLKGQTRVLEPDDPVGWCEMSVDQWDTLTIDQWAQAPVCNPPFSFGLTYDNVGNPEVEITDAGTIVSSFTFNRVMSRSLNGGPATTFTYDDFGRRNTVVAPDPDNPGSTLTTTYAWSPTGRLASVALPGAGGTVTYTYDGSNLLTQRQSPYQTRKYFWNGNALLSEQDGAGNAVVEYERGPDGYGSLNASHDVQGGSDDGSYQAFDPSGNVKRVYGDSPDANPDLTQQQVANAFGELKAVQAAPGSSTDPSLSFVAELGGMRDPDTGLIYLRQRWYDPTTKQFLSPDPLGVANSDVNPYRYGGNNPVENTDPSGLDYVTTRRGVAYWAVETSWGKDVNWIPLGTVDGDNVLFNDTFGGGSLDYDLLRKNAANTSTQRDISGFDYNNQVRAVRSTINELRRGKEIKREPSGVVIGGLSAEGFAAGAQAGQLQIADTFTFGQIDALSEANAAAWGNSGLQGTWYQTVSGGAALVAREALITAATLGTGAAIQGARAAAQGTRAATTAARLGGTASKTARFFNSARSPLAQGAAKLAGGSSAALRGTQAANFGLRGYEAVTTVKDAYDGYQMLRAGNPWGWLSIAGAGLSGVTAGVGGFGALRRLGKTGKDAVPTGAIARTQKAVKTASGCNCFVGGTEVLTPVGEKPIEQVRVGQRVLTYAPGEFEGSRPPVTELDAATAKQITLTLGEDPHAPGSPLTTVVLLRSDEWVKAKHLEVGGTIPLDLAELGVKGVATVAKIEDCPELEKPTEGIDSDGTRLVTATFHHTLGYPLDLKLEGLDTPLGVTKHHLIYSEDRQDWVEVGDLETHERVRVAGDVFEVEYAHARPQAEAVYNLEVDGDHVYRVTDAGVLVHNQSCEIGFRALTDDDFARVIDKQPIVARGEGFDIITQVQGRNSTGLVSISEELGDRTRGALFFDSGRGVVAIDMRKLADLKAGVIDHQAVLRAVRRNGLPRDVQHVIRAQEVLIKTMIPFEAIVDVVRKPL